MYRIQVRQTHPTGAWYWRIVSRNGQVILTSEVYSKRGNAIAAANKFADLAGDVWTLEIPKVNK